MDAATARRVIKDAAELEAEGVTAAALRRELRGGAVVRVYPGRFVARTTWDEQFEEGRHLLRVIAADSARRGGPAVVSHTSAAVVWGLPTFRHRCAFPHVSGATTNGHRGGRPVRNHEVGVSSSDRTVVTGIPCTTLERTVFDVIRTTSRETAVACADAALRRIAWSEDDRVYDDGAADAWRSSLHERIARSAGMRGIRQARWVADFADGRAHLPGESLSRLYLADLGFAPPRLQVPFEGSRGEKYRIDFGLDDVDAWGEFDGTGKYFDPELRRSGSTDRDEFLREKEREDWIRGRSRRPFARWGMPHIASASTLGARLASFHLFAPRGK